jgi:hypothetical protein
MAPRKKDIDEANKEENKLKHHGIVMNRHSTDTLCCIVFIVFIVALIGISGYGLSKGDPAKLLTPYDSDGNQCGYNNKTLNDLTDYPYKYIPELITGIDNITEALSSAVCVKECPTTSDQTFESNFCYPNSQFDDCTDLDSYQTMKIYSLCLPEYDPDNEVIKEVYQ